LTYFINFSRIPIADIFLSRRKRAAELQVASSPKPVLSSSKPDLSSSKPAAAFITPKMVKIGAVLNVVPPEKTSTTTSSSTTTTTTTTTDSLSEESFNKTGSQLSSGLNDSERMVGVEVATTELRPKVVTVEGTTSATTDRRPKVVSVDDDNLFLEGETAANGAKQFSSFDYGDKKLGNCFFS
jgi:hypothetical protein